MILLPERLPVAATLQEEGIPVGTYALGDALHVSRDAQAEASSFRRILFLNLMPEKEKAELDTCRALAYEDLCVQLIPIKISGLTYKNTPQSHMDAFYLDFEHVEPDAFDGLIINGAPLEHLPFEEVRYWPQLCHIMDWSLTHAGGVLHICWGAQAALYHHYGVPKYALPAKMFGVFDQHVHGESPFTHGLVPGFPMPNSRHTEVRATDISAVPALRILADSVESGVGLATDERRNLLFCFGHLEYAAETLQNEYLRDRTKGLPIALPKHYYEDDNPGGPIKFCWKPAAQSFYHNWLVQAVEHGCNPNGRVSLLESTAETEAKYSLNEK